MNLQCPNCQKMLNIEDKFAGQLMQCPMCGGTFTAPVLPGAMTSAVPLVSSAAPKSNPPAEEVFSLAAASASSTSPPGKESKSEEKPDSATPVADAPGSDHMMADGSGSDYPHRYIIWISPRVVPWIAPVALVLVFFLFFFYWRSIPSTVEKLIPEEPGSQIGWVKLFSSALMVFYLLMYLLALSLAIGSFLLTLKIVPVSPQIKHLLPWRAAIVAGVVAIAFLLILIACWAESFGTVWLRSTVCLHLIALIGLGLEFCLLRRGPNRPMPRIDVLW